MVGGEGHLAHQVGGDEDRTAFGGEGGEEGADPQHALRVQAVDRLVEDDGGGVAEECGGDAEPLAHAEREALDPSAGGVGQPGEVDDLLDAAARDAVGVGEGDEVVEGGPAGVDGAGLQQGADLGEGRGVGGVGASVDGGAAAGRGVEAEQHAHRRGLSGSVGTEESGDRAGADGEVEVLDDGSVAVPFGESVCRDHAVDATEPAGRGRPTGGGTWAGA
ncbi:hypothetical protein GCM10010504_42900 [Streptomyces griseus]|nr:hypothetical protein GCM10010504_42900 [Streptomyces griseus]